jgi:hypothetical protein
LFFYISSKISERCTRWAGHGLFERGNGPETALFIRGDITFKKYDL